MRNSCPCHGRSNKSTNKVFGKVSLERALSKLGLFSRSQTREFIMAGRLSVNGRTARNPLLMVIPEKDLFALDGQPLRHKAAKTIILYKPKGAVTTRSDERGRRTVYDLLPPELRHLHAVGRLDMASTGLLLMTSDTKLSAYLTDPANAIPRVYVVRVTGKVTPEEVARIKDGILDKGELLQPAKITLRKASGPESHLVLELTEGKNREIRRIFAALGHEVTHLKRVAFGRAELGNLRPGEFRPARPGELQ